MKRKLKKFLIILTLIIVIALVIVVLINRKKKVIVNDYTTGELANANAQNSEEVNSTDRTISNDDVKAIVNKYVKIPTEEEAQKINAGITNITSERITGITTITMDSVAREVFDSYGKGDVFILDGDENTPLKQVYFGKISSKYVDSNGNLIVEAQEPALDEIFDELNISTEGLLTEENVNRVQLEDGVSLKWVDDIDSEFEDISYLQDNKNTVVNLTEFNEDDNFIGPTQKLDDINIGGKLGFLFEFDLGLEYDITTQKFTSKANGEINSQVEKHLNVDELKMTNSDKTVDTQKGVEYSKDNVNDIETSKETSVETTKNSIKTTEKTEEVYHNYIEEDEKEVADATGFQNWKKDRLNYENKVDVGVKGKIGFDELSANLNIDYSLLDGFKDINVAFLGSALAEAEFKAEANLEIGGKRTKVEVPNIAKIEGLNKKLLPLGYLDFTGAYIPFGGVYSYIDKAPVCAGLMIYMDFNGKVNLSITAKASANYDFNFKVDIVKDGKFVNEVNLTDSMSANFEFSALASVTARADILGLSGIITVANVGVAEVVVFDFYIDFEAEAQFKATASYGTAKTIYSTENEVPKDKKAGWTTDVSATASGFVGVYVDIGRVKVNLKFTTLPGTNYSKTKSFEFDKAFITQTIWEYGFSDSKTGLDPNATYNEVSAVNDDYEIYRDTDGSLMRRSRETGQILKYDVGSFVIICGIDQTYIYLLQGSNSNYSIYRLKIQGGEIDTSKSIPVLTSTVSDMKIADNVGDVFLQDEKFIYFTEADDETTLKKVRRADRKVSTVCTFDGRKVLKVIDEEESNRLYVAVIDDSDLSIIFGGEPEAYFVSKNSSIDGTSNLKETAPVAYPKMEDGGYQMAAKYIGRTFLRNTVSRVDIIAKNGTTTEMKTDVGWNGDEIGEFAIHDETNPDGDTVHNLGYYSAETGEFVKLTKVINEYAVWTTALRKDGRIYFVDQDKNTGIKQLCSVAKTGGDKRVEKNFAEGEFNVDMNNTGVADMNGTMIFYSFSDDNIQVQLRYDFN